MNAASLPRSSACSAPYGTVRVSATIPRLRAQSAGKALCFAQGHTSTSCQATASWYAFGGRRDLWRGRSLICQMGTDGVHPNETPEEAFQRRVRESIQVDTHVTYIYTEQDFRRELANAGDKLVVLEVQSESVCETGLAEMPEEHWKYDEKKKWEEQMLKCVQIKHVFQRTARDCPDVIFLTLEAETEEAHMLCDKLQIEVLPTVQFYRNGKKLWQVAGTETIAGGAALGEGLLFYENSMGNGASATEFVHQIYNRAELKEFINASRDERVLTVLDVSLTDAMGCMKVYPAVVALAKSFSGFASFGRMLGDISPETYMILKELNIVEVPTFIFYRGGKEVGRHVGSSRGDLIGQILQVQAAAGVSPPPPPKDATRRRVRKSKATTY